MAFRRKARRDLTTEQQLARGPMDLIFLALVLLLTAVGLIVLLSASFAVIRYMMTPISISSARPASRWRAWSSCT